MNADRLAEELMCPITREILVDPVSLACCGVSVGRSALRSSLSSDPRCPLCRQRLGGPEVADRATPNRVAAALALAAGRGEENIGESRLGVGNSVPKEGRPQLTASYCLLPTPSFDGGRRIARLQLKVTEAKAVGLQRVLCVLVVDRSGSMSGSPWRQASTALKHVVAMDGAAHLSHVTLRIVTYNSAAYALDCTGGPEAVCRRIDNIRPGMGTSFRSAFDGTMAVVREEMMSTEQTATDGPSQTPQQVCVVFMTDGQAFENRSSLADELRTRINKFKAQCSSGPSQIVPEFTVHSVGFSSGCDKMLLESIRQSGDNPGQFRYCEPGDSEDALCGRLTGMFEQIAAHGGCSVTMKHWPHLNCKKNGTPPYSSWEFLGENGETLEPDENGQINVDLRVKADGVGTAVSWIALSTGGGSLPEGGLPVAFIFNESEKDKEKSGVEIPPDWVAVAEEDSTFSSADAIKRAWVGVRIHTIAEDAINIAQKALASKGPMAPEAIRLGGAFLEHRLHAVSVIGSDAHDRVPALLEQLRELRTWEAKAGSSGVLSIGRLRDLSSASAFSSSRAPVPSSLTTKPSSGEIEAKRKATIRKPASPRSRNMFTRESPVWYAGTVDWKGRNKLQKALIELGQRYGAGVIVSKMLEGMNQAEKAEVVGHPDNDGNTAFHLAAYHGQFDALPVLFGADPSTELDTTNHYGETPVTIAIKRRGYHKSLEVLRDLGGSVPEERVNGLITFCGQQGFSRTASCLEHLLTKGTLGPSGDGAKVKAEGKAARGERVTSTLPPLVFEDNIPHIVVQSQLHGALVSGRLVDWVSLVRAALKFADAEMLAKGLEKVEPDDLDVSQIFACCFPPKADSPDTPKYLALLENVLDFAPDLLGTTNKEAGDTLLHHAVLTGSLPHCQLLVERGLSPDVPNAAGDTPLHVACAKRYPCIVDFFVESYANVNARNKKGVTPVAVAVQMDTLRIVETLIAAGAVLDGTEAVAADGSNLLHVAVRNGRTKILPVLLDRADPDLLLEVDGLGLTPVLAAAADNREECLCLLIDSANEFAKTISEEKFGNILDQRTAPESMTVLPGATALHLATNNESARAVMALLARGADPNTLDGRGLAPLHRAAMRGNPEIVRMLISHGASVSLPDKSGRKPASYAGSNPNALAALVGPVPGPLLAFAAGDMEADAIAACADIVKQASSLAAEPGLFGAPAILDMPLDNHKQTALMIAVSHGNATAVDGLIQGGASPVSEDQRGLSAAAWAQMAKSRRLLGSLAVPSQPILPAATLYFEAVKKWGGAEASSIFLGQRRENTWPCHSSSTSLPSRLFFLAEAFRKAEETQESNQTGGPRSVALIKHAPRKGMVDRVSPSSQDSVNLFKADCRKSKINAAALVAMSSTSEGPRRPAHAFASLMATLHGPLLPALNDFLDQVQPSTKVSAVSIKDRATLDFVAALSDAIKEGASGCPKEAYALMPPELPLNALSVGSETVLSGFASATADLTTALSATEAWGGASGAFDESASGRRSPVAIIVSLCQQNGWLMGPSSSFPEDQEVLFRPGARFRVVKWYSGHAQVLDLPQEERKLLPGLTEEEIFKAIQENSPLVIHAHEI